MLPEARLSKFHPGFRHRGATSINSLPNGRQCGCTHPTVVSRKVEHRGGYRNRGKPDAPFAVRSVNPVNMNLPLLDIQGP